MSDDDFNAELMRKKVIQGIAEEFERLRDSGIIDTYITYTFSRILKGAAITCSKNIDLEDIGMIRAFLDQVEQRILEAENAAVRH